jgi:hypothetical protein
MNMVFAFKRIHLPTGREYTGTFNVTHNTCFHDPQGYSPRHIQKTIERLIEKWNKQQPTMWRYFI